MSSGSSADHWPSSSAASAAEQRVAVLPQELLLFRGMSAFSQADSDSCHDERPVGLFDALFGGGGEKLAVLADQVRVDPGQRKLVQGGTGAGAGEDAGVVAVVVACLRVGRRVEPFGGRGERDVVKEKPRGLAGLQPFFP